MVSLIHEPECVGVRLSLVLIHIHPLKHWLLILLLLVVHEHLIIHLWLLEAHLILLTIHRILHLVHLWLHWVSTHLHAHWLLHLTLHLHSTHVCPHHRILLHHHSLLLLLLVLIIHGHLIHILLAHLLLLTKQHVWIEAWLESAIDLLRSLLLLLTL